MGENPGKNKNKLSLLFPSSVNGTNSQFSRLKILHSSLNPLLPCIHPFSHAITGKSWDSMVHLPSQWSTSLPWAPTIRSQWRPDKAGSQEILNLDLSLSCLPAWRLIQMPSFSRCPRSHAITLYFVISVALAISHMTCHILVYVICEVHFLYKTRTSLVGRKCVWRSV